jgi:hypothetical protein
MACSVARVMHASLAAPLAAARALNVPAWFSDSGDLSQRQAGLCAGSGPTFCSAAERASLSRLPSRRMASTAGVAS